MTDSSWALQQAVFATLAADGAVKDAAGDPPRLYDSVPRGAAFPYIVIGDDAESDNATATGPGSTHALTIHVWSRAAGRKEARRAVAAVRGALDGAELTLDGHALIDIRWQSSAVTREPDGETFHAQLRFKALTEPI
jgi:hypothetical protein